MELITKDLNSINIKHDIFFYESELHRNNNIDNVISDLNNNGFVYEGMLEKPKSKVEGDWEPRNQTLFNSSKFGDDMDRALKKSDGTFTYFASDIEGLSLSK